MNFRKKAAALPSFQFSAMIDVVFLLLCFFITSSVFSQWELEVDVVLPTADSAKTPERLPGEIIINLGRDGAISVNQQALSLGELERRLTRLSKFFPGQPVVVRADKATVYENVMKVIDTCRKSDIWNISFATNADEKAPANAGTQAP